MCIPEAIPVLVKRIRYFEQTIPFMSGKKKELLAEVLEEEKRLYAALVGGREKVAMSEEAEG